jgi:hypothetical protein
MSADPLIDEDYASEDDSDFTPDVVPAEGEGSDFDSEAEAEAVDGQVKGNKNSTTSKRRRTGNDDTAGDVDFENSGDEAIVQKGKRRRKKTGGDDETGTPGHEGGEGGLIKTRSQRAQEKAERKAHAASGPVTINVDDLWSQMTAAPIIPSKAPKIDAVQDTTQRDGANGDADKATSEDASGKGNGDPPHMIKIKRTYNFAGKVHTEEKLVARDSAEAKLYLASLGPNKNPEDANNNDEEEEEEQKPKPRKAFRSRFEPVMEGLAQRGDLNLGINTRLEIREQQRVKAKKLNVVEKSRMDWAGFVDKEGIKDELELAGKSKESFASRQDFLRRVEAKKEAEARRARIAGRA